MLNPILHQLTKRTQRQNQINPAAMIREFNKFKSSLTGDPKAIVEQLLASGQMTQEQFEELKEQAISLQEILK